MLRFGFKRQTLEIGGLEVLDYARTQAYACASADPFQLCRA